MNIEIGVKVQSIISFNPARVEPPTSGDGIKKDKDEDIWPGRARD